MPTTIDDRVVRMSFDNQGFESGVRTTMSSLEKLKESLNFKKSSGDLNLSGIASGVAQLNKKFSALGIVGMTAMQDISRSAIQMGKTLVNAVSIDAMKDGFREYELQMDSVKTIMSSTGEDIQTVSRYIDELNHYADKTIYSFSDMTRNIGKFTNAGVKLEDAVMAIKGIANEAAVSGANSNEASRAMYNFAQALSQGSVKLRDWMSIENANMATQEFKQQLIDTAVELGTLEKQADNTYKVLTTNAKGGLMGETITANKNFRDSLSNNWLTTEVLTQTLKRYADETTEIGKKAYNAAQEVRTFTKMIDALKEALGSSWNKTFQLIFGNVEEATKFWTSISEAITEVIDKINAPRNKMLDIWHNLGGRDAMIKSIEYTWKTIKQIFGTIQKSFEDVFPPMTGKKLVELSEKIRDFTARTKLNKHQLELLRDTFTGLFSVLKILQRVIISTINTIKPAFNALKPIGKIIAEIIAAISRFITNVSNADNMIKYFSENVKGLISEISKIIKVLFKDFKYTDFLKPFSDKFQEIITDIKNGITELFPQLENVFKKLDKTLDSTSKRVSDFFSKFTKKNKVDKATKSVKKLNEQLKENTKKSGKKKSEELDLNEYEQLVPKLKSIWTGNDNLVLKLNNTIKALKKWKKNFKQLGILTVAKEILHLGDSFEKTTNKINGSLGKIKKPKSNIGSIFSIITGPVVTYIDVLKKGIPQVIGLVNKLVDYVQTNFPKLVKYFAGDNFGDLLDNVQKIMTIGWYNRINRITATINDQINDLGQSFTKLPKVISAGTEKVTNAVGDTLNDLHKMVDKGGNVFKDDHISTNLLKLAGSIAVLSFSLVQLSKVKPQQLGLALGALTAEFVILFKAFSTVQSLSKNMSSFGEMAAISVITGQLITIGLAISQFSSTVKTLGSLDTKTLIQGVIGLFTVTEILLHSVKKLSSINDNSASGIVSLEVVSKGLITFSIGVLILAQSVKSLGKLNLTEFAQGLVGVLVLLEAISLFTKEAKQYQMDIKSAIALVLTIEAIKIMTKAATNLGSMNLGSFTQGLSGVLVLLGAIYLFTKEAKTYQIDVKSALALILTIEAIKIMSKAALSLGSIKFQSFIQGLFGVIALLEAINLFTKEAQALNVNAGTIVSLFAVTYVISEFTKKIVELSELDFKQVMQGTIAIVTSIGALFVFLRAMADQKIKVSDLATLISVGAAVLNVAKSIVLLGELPQKQLEQGAFTVAGVLLTLIGVITILANVKGGSIKEGAAALVVLAVGIMVMVPSLQKLSSLNADQITSLIISLGGSLMILSATLYFLGNNIETINKGSVAMIVMAAALLILAPAVKIFSTIPVDTIAPSLITLAGSLVILGVAGYAMGTNALQIIAGGAALVVLATGILVLAPAVRLLGSMDMGQVVGSLIALAGALTILYVAGMAFGQSSIVIAAGAKALLIFGGSIALLGAGLLAIGYALPIIGIGVKQLADSLDKVGAELIEDMAKELGKIAKMVADFLKELFANIAIGIKENFPKIANFLFELFVGMINGIANIIRDKAPVLIAAIRNLLSSILELLITVEQDFLRLIPGLGDFLANKLEGVKTSIRERLAPESMKEIGAKAIGLDGLAGGIQSQEGTVTNTSGDLSDKILDRFENMLTGGQGFNIGSMLGVDMSQGMNSSIGLLNNSSANMGDTVLNNLNIDTMSEGQNAVQGYINGWNDKSCLNALQHSVDGIGNYTIDTLRTSLDSHSPSRKTMKIGYDAVQGYVNGLGENILKVRDVIQKIAREGLSAFSSKEKDYEKAGENAGDGFAKGMSLRHVRDNVIKKAALLASEAVAALYKALDSHSPSKKTMKVGGFAGEGFALGLANMSKMVKSKAAKLGSNALDGMRAALANLSDMASADMITDPMIRPVLDLSEIQNGIGTMNGMFGSPMVGLRASLAGTGQTVQDLYGAASAMRITGGSNSDVVSEMVALRSDVKNLGQAMSQMKMYMDGKEVGGIVSGEVDRRLGIRYLHNKREGRIR